uniref:C-type lectin domain-containing protein n=1 Tax=Mastacembelus armatus TaxID=205130 RepID=A0A3Q3MSR8_9TELE
HTLYLILLLTGFCILYYNALVVFSGYCQCKPGWREFESKCYYFSRETKNWMEANAICLEQNSNLMSIQSINERLWVRTQIATDIYWIGLNDRVTEGPDNWGDEPGEDCGQVVGDRSGQWNDEGCNVNRRYICKYINCKTFYFIL